MNLQPVPCPLDPAEDSIRRLMGLFYERVRGDALLGPVFAKAIGTSDAAWTQHLDRLANFWSSVVLRTGRYHGDPFSTHLRLPGLEPEMFERWLELFGESCRDVLAPDMAEMFLDRAHRIARSLRMGLFERLPGKSAMSAAP